MLNHNLRYGNWTSSQIGNLCTIGKREMTFTELQEHLKANPKSKAKQIADGWGKPAITYIEKKKYEARLGQRIEVETTAKSLSWGKLVEKWVFSKTNILWNLTSDETTPHPDIPFWAGSKDCIKLQNNVKTVGDIKSPFTKLSYCRMADICIENNPELLKEHEPIYYWQLVSNAIINNCTHAELLIGMPYLDELAEIKELANLVDEAEKYEYYWIAAGSNEQLPYLIRDTFYKNYYSIGFKIPDDDIVFLTDRVLKANEERKYWGVPEIEK